MGRGLQSAIIALIVWVSTWSGQAANAAYTVKADEYVRIHATLRVDGEDRSSIITLTDCLPDFEKYEFKALLRSSQQLNLGIAFALPDQKEVQLNPIVMTKSADFWASWFPSWFSPSCKTTLDRIDYRSPLFLASTYADRPFQISLRKKENAQLDPGVIGATDALWNAVAPLSKLPAGLTKIIDIKEIANTLGTGNDDMEKFSLQINSPGAVSNAIPLPRATTITLSDRSSILQRNVVITVEMEAVPSMFLFPPSTGWTPNDVLRVNFPVASTVQTTNSASDVRHFMTTYLAEDLTDYVSAQDLVRAEAKCESIKHLVDAMALSSHDASLVLWAEVHQNVKFQDDPALDGLDCLKSQWSALNAAGIAPRTQPLIADVPPSSDDMIAAASKSAALAVFFEALTWDARQGGAASLFAYPMNYAEDGPNVLRTGSTSLDGPEGWLGLTPKRDQQYFSHFGCYVPLAPDAISKLGLSAELGADNSVMLAVGELPRRKKAYVFGALSYKPHVPGSKAQILSVRFSATPSPKEKEAMLSQWPRGSCGETHLRPGFLFKP